MPKISLAIQPKLPWDYTLIAAVRSPDCHTYIVTSRADEAQPFVVHALGDDGNCTNGYYYATRREAYERMVALALR